MPPIKFIPIRPESGGALRYSLNIFKYSTMRLISETGLPFNAEEQRLQHTVNIPVSVAPLIRVFRPLMFCQVFPWSQVFQ